MTIEEIKKLYNIEEKTARIKPNENYEEESIKASKEGLKIEGYDIQDIRTKYKEEELRQVFKENQPEYLYYQEYDNYLKQADKKKYLTIHSKSNVKTKLKKFMTDLNEFRFITITLEDAESKEEVSRALKVQIQRYFSKIGVTQYKLYVDFGAKNGRLHFHGVTNNSSFLNTNLKGKRVKSHGKIITSYQLPKQLITNNIGFITFSKVINLKEDYKDNKDACKNIASYTTKIISQYITKEEILNTKLISSRKTKELKTKE